MKKNALVIGASGLVGHALKRRLQGRASKYERVIGTYCSYTMPDLVYLDYQDSKEVSGLLNRIKPSAVFCPAAVSNVDWCEDHPDESWNVNVRPIEFLARECAKIGALLVYISSDYIFDGKSGPYRENDTPNPLNIYGKHKLAAEQLIREILSSSHIIIRTTVLYGWEPQGKNFVVRLLNALSEGKSVKVPIDQIGTPTYVPFLVNAICELVEQKRMGTWHLAGEALMSRYDLALLVTEVFNLSSGLVIPVVTTDLLQKATRPLIAGLVSEKICDTEVSIAGPEEGLVAMRKECVQTEYSSHKVI